MIHKICVIAIFAFSLLNVTNATAVQPQISSGSSHVLLLKNDGTVWSWGANGNGQLGNGSVTDSKSPLQVSTLSGFLGISGGGSHSMGLKSDGTVWTWGTNGSGQLGNDGGGSATQTPSRITGLTGLVAIDAGSSHSVAIRNDGTVWSWGTNGSGQLGNTSVSQSSTPVQVTGLTGVTAISAGDSHTVALKNDGTVWTWGYNAYGQLGNGTTTNGATAAKITGLTGVVAISAGSLHTLALKSDGTVWAWGYNVAGQLGDNSRTDRSTPVQVTGLSGISAISAGGNHSIALGSDGAVWAWGSNDYGQLGDGTTSAIWVPEKISGVSQITSVSAGNIFTAALKSDGTVWTWGYNAQGQLGDGTTTSSKIPKRLYDFLALGDTLLPTITSFVIPATSESETVSLTFTVVDNVAVDAYCLTENNDPAACLWVTTVPTTYMFSVLSKGIPTNRVLYGFAKDTAGNISAGSSASTVITLSSLDSVAPIISSFTIQGISTSLIVPISTLTVTDNFAVVGYCLIETNSATACTWSSTKPANFTFSSAGSKALYAFAKDAAGNISNAASAMITINLPDTVAPSINAFSIPTNSNSLTVSISNFVVTDNVAVTGYCLVESNVSSGCTWLATKPTTFTFASAGSKSLYAFVKDATGNISSSASAVVTITLPDTTSPVISSFAIPTTSISLMVTITSLTATDNVAVSGYCLLENNNATGCSWSTTKPTSYSFSSAGAKTLYAFAKDAAGNISTVAQSATIISLPDTAPPTVAVTSPANGTNGIVLWQVDGTASDNNSLTKVDVQIYNGIRYISATGQFSATAAWVTATTSDNWQHWSLDTSNFSMNNVDGTYTITARATDGSGNVSIPAVVSFTRGSVTGGGTATLLVSKSEAAAGTVTSAPTGISCDALCGATGASYTTGASVNLIATPATGYYFLNWSNCDLPNGSSCTVAVTTNHATVTANFNRKSITALSLAPHSQTLTLNQNLTVGGRLVSVPDSPSADLNNQTVSVTIKGPDGLQTLETKTSDNSGTWSLPLSLFTQKGTYFISASYAGTQKMMNSASDSTTILVAKSAGYAIIVQGKLSSNEGLLDHQHTTDMIRNKLMQRMFLADDITYLKSTVNSSPSKADVQDAITNWAKNKLNSSPAPLVVVFVDHGTPEKFYIGTDSITPQDLAGWMTTLDNSLTAEARAENQIVVIGTCYSGSFIPALSRQGRIIIASAAATEQSIRGTLVGFSGDIKIRQGEAFLEELFSRLGSGIYMGDAFKQAVDALTPKIPRITNGMQNIFLDNISQHPLLDADGDGTGSYHLDGTSDGLAIAKLVTGEGAFNSGIYPADIHDVTATQYLQSYEANALLWLKAVQDSSVGAAWIEIRKPDTPLMSSAGIGQIIIDLETITLSHNIATGQWETSYSGFTLPGTYEIYYYTQDKQTGDISLMVRSLIYKNKVDNNSPVAFGLTTPTDMSSQKTVLVLEWQQSSDPESDPFRYTLQISRDKTFATTDYHREEITDNQIALDSDTGIADATVYYWRVIAVDQYGAQKNSTQTWSFTTDNTNGLPGFIKGYVRNSASSAPISGAQISIGAGAFSTLANGAYLIAASPGSYTLTVTAAGYGQKTQSLTAVAGKVVSADINLTASSKQVPSITWANPAAITYGTALSSTQLNASTSAVGTFAYVPALTTVLSSGTQTLNANFTPSDAFVYSTATTSVTITVNKASATVALSGLNQNYTGTTRVVTATTTPAGLITNITYNGSTTAPISAGTYPIVATITDANYTGFATGNLAIIAIKPGDCDADGTVTIAEVQSAINMFLGLKAVAACVDTSGDNSVSIAEVQKAINSFLGL